MKTYGKQLVLSLMALCSVGVLLVSCHDDHFVEEEMPREDKNFVTINLNLTVPAAAESTRASGHGNEDGTAAENYINVKDNDYKILVFDKYGKNATDKLETIECKINESSGATLSYTLQAKLNVNKDEEEQMSTFKVMVLANWKSFDNTNYPKSTSEHTLDGIYADGNNFNFSILHTEDSKDHSLSSWIPSMSAPAVKAIPMFGIAELYLKKVTESDNPVFTIPMLRSIAKVEVIDVKGDHISNVSLSSSNKNGRFIPNVKQNPDWSGNTQIENPSLPASLVSIQNLEFNQEGNKWVAYIPEMNLQGNSRPKFNLSGQADFEADFDNYAEGQPTGDLEAVLRNHIYRFNVTITDAKSVSIKTEVLPWDMEYDDNPWYYDSPKIPEGGWLTWFSGANKTVINQKQVDAGEEKPKYSYNGFIEDTGNLQLTMNPGIEDFAEATFTLDAPKNCQWHAELVHLDGRPDAFYFVDENGVEITENGGWPYGTVNGNPATIRIKNRKEQVTTNPNEMRLVIFVEYPDKIMREVKVVEAVTIDDESTEGGKKKIDNYTIVQDQTDIY